MLRLFTGISIPLEIKERLNLMHGGIEGARWTDTNDYHITLSFIGDIHEDEAELIDEVLSKIKFPSFNLELKEVGCFTRGEKVTFIWAGLKHSEELHALKHKIDSAFERNKITFEKRKYTPHVTIAKLHGNHKKQAALFIEEHNLFKSEPFKVDDFILYQSHQAKEKSFYTEKVLYPLLDK